MSGVTDVLVPPNGEGTRATVLRWCKVVGDAVIKDEPLLELETDKVTVEVPAPASGILIEVLKQVDAEVVPDDVLARLSLNGESTAPPAAVPTFAVATPQDPPAASSVRDASRPLSPSVRRLLHEHSIAAADIDGTGRNGRITAQDVTRHAADSEARISDSEARITDSDARAGSSRIPHTAIRRRVAEHMARSLIEAPHVTTLFEADLTRVLAHRTRHAPGYESRGARLTLTAYFISACVRALRAHREVNATYHEDALE